MKDREEVTTNGRAAFSYWANKSNGKLYTVQGSATNATNGRENESLILYTDQEGQLWARNKVEFESKFAMCTNVEFDEESNEELDEGVVVD